MHFVLDRPHLNDGARVVRVKPRYNPDVNQWWLCDEGRYGLGWLDRERLTEVRAANGAAATWEQALTTISTALAGEGKKEGGARVGVIASAQLTNEELFLVREIFQGALGARVTASVPETPGSSDDLLIKADKNPNTLGVTLLGLAGPDAPDAGQIVEEALTGNLDALWVFGHDMVEFFGEGKVRELSEKIRIVRLFWHEREPDRVVRSLGPAHVRLCGEGRDLRELRRPGSAHQLGFSSAWRLP